MHRIVSILMCLLPLLATAQNIRIVHCVNGECPSGAGVDDTLVVRELFAFSNSAESKFSEWVAYRVTRATIETSDDLDRDWQSDDLLDEQDTLEPADYTGAFSEIGVDRGHQAPLASFAGTVFWRSTNYLSNITPQKSGLNRGPWVDLESAVREAVYDVGDLYIVTGPLYDSTEEQLQLPNTSKTHLVPTGYFKVIADQFGKVTSFLFDQDDTRATNPYCDAITNLQEIENLSGYTIFPNLNVNTNSNLDSILGCM